MKLLILNTLLSVATISSVVFTAKAQANTGCYMIDSSGNFTDLTGIICQNQEVDNTPDVEVQEDLVTPTRVNNSATENVSNEPRTSCTSFNGDWDEAQAYMENNDAEYLDGNGDGLACDNLRRNPEFGILSRETWQELKNRQSPSLNEGKPELTLGEVQRIIGFNGVMISSSLGSQTYKWRNSQNPEQFIQAIFVNGKLNKNSSNL